MATGSSPGGGGGRMRPNAGGGGHRELCKQTVDSSDEQLGRVREPPVHLVSVRPPRRDADSRPRALTRHETHALP
ncbi:Hypothetical protein NTJ_03828 [Nesidiocoris tenuis]|uniref:Uncharacterized protein n=1 Tax=Nesidiocoris tenuis TaxID=355587 RepID=A0ABN7AIB4_9HEMI|nr:Hypothetical protein NTJ_03828 [Nesidiocoris tenuis]